MKLDDLKAITRNIEQGAWVRDLPNLPGVALKVRGTFNADYSRLMAKLMAQRTPEQVGNEEEDEKLEIQLLHETILVDWSGIEDAPYSPDMALKLLSDPELAVFRGAVRYAGNVVARQGKQSLENDAKN